jgi:hypothetical protein
MSTQLTRAQCVTHRDEWLAAESAVSTGQTIQIGGRTLTRVELPHIRASINYWSAQVDAFDAAAAADSGPRNHGFRVADFR